MHEEEITVKKLDELGLAIIEEKELLAQEKSILSEKVKAHEGKKASFLKLLEALEKKSYPVGAFNFYTIDKFSVTTPKGEDGLKFFDWCWDTKGADYVKNQFKMNSNTLNSFYREEMDLAAERKDPGFGIPGIGAPKLHTTLGIRKK